MRLNVNRYLEIINEKGIEGATVRDAVGLSEKTYCWILDKQFIELSTLERMADAIGCKVREICLPDHKGYTENVLEWLKDADQATLTLSQHRTITRVRQLAAKYPEECEIVAENKDGSICAHVPVNWVKIGPPRNISDEQRRQASERMLAMHRDGVFSNAIIEING